MNQIGESKSIVSDVFYNFGETPQFKVTIKKQELESFGIEDINKMGFSDYTSQNFLIAQKNNRVQLSENSSCHSSKSQFSDQYMQQKSISSNTYGKDSFSKCARDSISDCGKDPSFVFPQENKIDKAQNIYNNLSSSHNYVININNSSQQKSNQSEEPPGFVIIEQEQKMIRECKESSGSNNNIQNSKNVGINKIPIFNNTSTPSNTKSKSHSNFLIVETKFLEKELCNAPNNDTILSNSNQIINSQINSNFVDSNQKSTEKNNEGNLNRNTGFNRDNLLASFFKKKSAYINLNNEQRDINQCTEDRCNNQNENLEFSKNYTQNDKTNNLILLTSKNPQKLNQDLHSPKISKSKEKNNHGNELLSNNPNLPIEIIYENNSDDKCQIVVPAVNKRRMNKSNSEKLLKRSDSNKTHLQRNISENYIHSSTSINK